MASTKLPAANNGDTPSNRGLLYSAPLPLPPTPSHSPSALLKAHPISSLDNPSMAVQPQKRLHGDDRPGPDAAPPRKKTKIQRQHTKSASWTYPPEFWDGLPEVLLTRGALKEHRRRIRLQRQQHPPPRPPPASTEPVADLVEVLSAKSLCQFAKHGGPDLSDLRGYRLPVIQNPLLIAMDAGQAAGVDPATTETKTKTTKSTPYTHNFEMHMNSHGIHPAYCSQRPDLTQVREVLEIPRPSLSPSIFSDEAYDIFQESESRARNEADVVANVVPAIMGVQRPALAPGRNVVFRNLEPLTDGSITLPMPDIYYGAPPEELSEVVLNEIGGHVMPTILAGMPVAPNFFLEVKGPYGLPGVAERQARYEGAIGARAMHTLQNYGEAEPQYDGKPYTYSSTYQTGMLKIYAHHSTAPKNEGGRPEYHMTQVKAYAVVSDRDTFVKGATAFRNVRDLAKQHRDVFIQAANAKASQPVQRNNVQPIPRVEERAEEAQDAAHDCPQWQDYDADLQQSAANVNGYDLQDNDAAAAISQPEPEESVPDSANPDDGPSTVSNSTKRLRSNRLSSSGIDHSSKKSKAGENTTAD